jgi:hypothetical protein
MLDLDPEPSGQDIADHHARCRTCSALHAHGHARADRAVLDAWRRQLAEHLVNERLLQQEDPEVGAG